MAEIIKSREGYARAPDRSPAEASLEAGVEPDHPLLTNRLMTHDFRRNILISRRFQPWIESPGVPYSPLESTPVVETFWRRSRLDN